MVKPIGQFAQAMFLAIEKATAMEADAALYIKSQFAVEDELTLENLTWDKLLKEIASARAEGRYEELQGRLAELITPALEQAFAQEPQ